MAPHGMICNIYWDVLCCGFDGDDCIWVKEIGGFSDV